MREREKERERKRERRGERTKREKETRTTPERCWWARDRSVAVRVRASGPIGPQPRRAKRTAQPPPIADEDGDCKY